MAEETASVKNGAAEALDPDAKNGCNAELDIREKTV